MTGYTYVDSKGKETECLFVKNLQGDVERVIDLAGNTLAAYTYDAWGNILSSSGSLAAANPIRYRSYYYDSESGLYYVSSRYYDPLVGRFINADNLGALTKDFENFVQYNLYAYCFNNPIDMSDETGAWPDCTTKLAVGIGAIVIGAVVVAATAATGGAVAAFSGALIAGGKAAAISGSIGAVVGTGTSAVSYYISTGGLEGAGKAVLNGAVNGFADGFMTGGITSAVGMAVGAIGKTSTGIQIGTTAKPQYGKVNACYGTPKTNGTTLLSIQNSAGKRVFSIDFDAVHAVHMHLPKIYSNTHIPIGSIVSGVYAGGKQW